MADINATDLTEEILSTLSGNEQFVMFDPIEGKRAALSVIANYIAEHGEINGDDIPTIITAIQNELSDLKEDLSTKADQNGVYPDLSAGNITGDFHIDTKPYLYRALRDVASHIGSKAFDTLVGGSVAVNQTIKNGNFADTSEWSFNGTGTFTVSGNVATIKCGTANRLQQALSDMIIGHKYLLLGEFKINENIGSAGIDVRLSDGSHDYGKVLDNTVSTWQKVALVIDNQYMTTNVYVMLRDGAATKSEFQAKNVQRFDLTQLFASDPSIADRAYTLEQGTAGSGIAWLKSYGYIRDGYIPYNQGTLQSVKTSAHVTRDADDTIIGNYPLDNIELRGVAKLVGSEIKYDGDVYESDGTVTRKYGIVDLSTLNWTWVSPYFKATFSDLKYVPNNTTLGNATAEKYTLRIASGMSVSAVGEFAIDTADIKVTTGSNAIQPTGYMIYEKTTNTTETADPFTSPQTVFSDGTEEYLDARTVPIPVGHETKYELDLASKLIGLPWDMSMIAPVEVEYKATRNYTAGQYLIVDNTLYKVTSNISNGGTITPNSNVTETTVATELIALA